MDDEKARGEVLGLGPGTVALRDHMPKWHQLYEEEALLIKTAIGTHLLDIQHVGSTAVPHLKAKPIIDMFAGVSSLDCALAVIDPLSRIGYRYLADNVVPVHHLFGKGSPRSYLLHVVQHQGKVWKRVISFRDILLNYPRVASEYEALKVRLSQQFTTQIGAYTISKSSFIDRVLKELAPAALKTEIRGK